MAQRLCLSPRTVGARLSSIHTERGVATRMAAGRFAIESHLA